jgi:hypothetical protein
LQRIKNTVATEELPDPAVGARKVHEPPTTSLFRLHPTRPSQDDLS